MIHNKDDKSLKCFIKHINLELYIKIFVYLFDTHLKGDEKRRKLILENNKKALEYTKKDIDYIPNIIYEYNKEKLLKSVNYRDKLAVEKLAKKLSMT